MGGNLSQLERSSPSDLPPSENYLGLVNFGNTCYANSVLQALYFCLPFRKHVLSCYTEEKSPESILSAMADLYHQMKSSKRKFGSLQPRKFIGRLRKDNALFDNYQQQDAHEFLNFLLNHIADQLTEKKKSQAGDNGVVEPQSTWIHEIFQGVLTNETQCLSCETVRSKDEDFLDLSIDLEQNTSITQCLKTFSTSEVLSMECKYYCEQCCSKQEATKRLRVKKLPKILALHLKRFKYMEALHRYVKLSYRVPFPWELKLFNTSCEVTDRMYDLTAVVIHCGSGPTRGHYITIVKSHNRWLSFDDEYVEEIPAHTIEQFYGLPEGQRGQVTECGYILFYQSRE